MNKKQFGPLKLRDGEALNLDLSSAMVKGNNTAVLIGTGELGASATVMISDSKVQQAFAAKIAGQSLPAQMSLAARRQKSRQNLIWGNLVEEIEETSRLTLADSSSQTVPVTFTRALDLNVASDSARYEVEVNNRPVEVESVYPEVDADTFTFVLRLAKTELETGDKVMVFWDDLRDDRGRPLFGRVGPLIVQSLQ